MVDFGLTPFGFFGITPFGVGTKCMTVREAIDAIAGIILQILGDNPIVTWLVIVAVIPVYMPY